QLADAYLERKQRETGRVIGHEDYLLEKQKVKAYLADNRVFGVDRNPVAIELAEISLWLNTIYEGHTIPWFGSQLVAGNSLIGARRQVFTKGQLESQNREWLRSIPERVPLDKERENSQIWHFLVPDEGMAHYTDKAVNEMLPAEMKQIRDWRKEFTKPFSAGDTRALGRLSAAVDRLCKKHCKDLRQVRHDTAHVFPVFAQESNPAFAERGQRLTTHQRDEILERTITPGSGQASAYQRLKLAMDYWCSLWFWPVEQVALLPSRDEFLLELSAILEGTSQELSPLLGAEQQPLFPGAKPEQAQLLLAEDLGSVNLEEVCASLPRLKRVREIAARHRFLHCELSFADVFQDRGGFDLSLGNPPWIKIDWNEGGVMGDFEPMFVLRSFSAPQLDRLRAQKMNEIPQLRQAYLDEYVDQTATQKFLSSIQMFPLLQGSKANSFKCFIAQAWFVARRSGVQAFLHPEGAYDDPNGGVMRERLYQRLIYHFHFINEHQLFAEVDHHVSFSVNVYGLSKTTPSFLHLANLFTPSTVDACFDHDGRGLVGGIKNDSNEWNTDGHAHRILHIDANTLKLFARLHDEAGTPALQAKLPALHAQELLDVLRKFVQYPETIAEHKGDYRTTYCWDETAAVSDGTIRRDTSFPATASELILSGPHIWVANPLYKTPRRVCAANGHYEVVSLNTIETNYLPRTNYLPGCNPAEYLSRMAAVEWNSNGPISGTYRLAHRAMLSQTGERTLVGAIIPKHCGHINGVQSTSFRSHERLLQSALMSASLVADFVLKTTGRSNLQYAWETFPSLQLQPRATLNVLRLNCLTADYSELWTKCWLQVYMTYRWAKIDERLADSQFSQLCVDWAKATPLRADYERRQALVEIDVLVAMQLGLTVNELCTIYRIQFPVLRQYEQDTWYDRRGQIVFTASKGLTGIGFSRPEWEKIRGITSGTVTRTIQDDTLPGGPRQRVIEHVAPFDRCDREADYATAWKFFDEVGG
ncbi:MAG: hypothetical protein WBW33_24670, partial [Bryobacteraceae bacterium]